MNNKLLSVIAAAGGICLSQIHFAFGQSVNFNPGAYGVGPAPACVVVADVNGDGAPDLIAAHNTVRGILTVLTNDGAGNFAFSSTLSVGTNPACVLAADINGDGAPDLICANFGLGGRFGGLTILTNDGTGVFGSNATINLPGEPFSLAAADVNGDGKLDLIVANQGNDTLTVLTNNGSGVLGSNATLMVGSAPSSVIAADVNGDGKPDLICANFYGNSLSVLTNNGSGVFGSNATLKVGYAPICVVAADVNGDGRPDLVTANYGTNSLTVLFNNGSGGFSSNATYAVGIQPQSVAAADLDGDGRLDLVCANYYAGGPGSLTVLTNSGSGRFGFSATLSVTNLPDWITTADLDGDGKQDLVCASVGGALYPYYGTVTVLLNTTPAPAQPPLYIAAPGPKSIHVSWSSFAAGFVLQTNSDLARTNWATAGFSVATNAGIESVTLSPAPSGRLFFRLAHP